MNTIESQYELCFEDSWLKIYWHPGLNMVKYFPTGSPVGNQVKEGTAEMAGLLAAKQCTKMMLHFTVPMHLGEQDRAYVLEESYPFYWQCGLRHLAYVYLPDIQPPLLAKKILGQFGFNLALFSDEHKALQWLGEIG
jgi:hypothetical protein